MIGEPIRRTPQKLRGLYLPSTDISDATLANAMRLAAMPARYLPVNGHGLIGFTLFARDSRGRQTAIC